MLIKARCLLIAVLALMAGCDDPAPEARLIFPPPSGIYTGDTLRFRGEVRFNASDRIAVTVEGANSVAAIATLDDAGNTFAVDVDLGTGSLLDLTLKAENLQSNKALQLPVRVNRNAFGVRSTAIVALLDSGDGIAQLVTTDVRLEALILVDTRTGERQILSSTERGEGPIFQQPTSLNFHEGSLYLLDKAQGVFRVDPDTGDRILLSGGSVGEGVALVTPVAMAIRDDELIVADIGLDALVQINLRSGARQQVFAEFVADGPVILSPKDIAFGPSGDVLIADDSWRAIFSVDLSQGTFDVVANFEVGEGIALALPRALLVTSGDDLLVLDGGRDALISVSRQTGDRRVISDNNLNNGPGFDVPVDAALANNQVFVSDNGSGSIYQIDLQTGERTLISQVRQGEGDRLQAPFDIVDLGDRFILTDSAADSLIEIDLVSGDRRTLLSSTQTLPFPGPDYLNVDGNRLLFSYSRFDSPGLVLYLLDEERIETLAAPGVGTGPLLILPTEPVFRQRTSQYLVFDAFEQHLVSIDPNSLERQILFDDKANPAIAFSNVTSTTTHDAGDRWYLLDSVASRIISLDLDTGVRELLLPAESTRDLVDIEYDGDRLLLIDQSAAALIALNLLDGQLTDISGKNRGLGPEFERPVQMSINRVDQLAIVVDVALDAVFVVDLTTGDRVIVSR